MVLVSGGWNTAVAIAKTTTVVAMGKEKPSQSASVQLL
jgi:hypothetical protein